MGTNQKVTVYGKEYTPQQISAFILQKIKKDTETYLGTPIRKAVITVPAHFDDNQRQATKDAGEIAGFEVMRIINEPTAACLAYGIDKLEKEMKILVFSFGGGTHDVTVMDFGKGVFQVLSTSGDTQLGGTDVDKAIMAYVTEEFKRQTGVDITNDQMATARLKEAAEKAKIELTTLMSTDIDLPFLTATNTGPQHLHLTLTRTKLESLAQPIVQRTERTILKALEDAKLTPQGVDKIILIGGMTRMPLVQRFVEQILGKAPERGLRPNGMCSHRCSHSRRSSNRRSQRHLATGRYAPVTRRRDYGRHLHQSNRQKHHHTHQEEPSLHNRSRLPNRRHNPRATRRTSNVSRQRFVGHVQPGRHPTSAKRSATNRSNF